jgi:nucleoside-diphosphate-sugar epimerase
MNNHHSPQTTVTTNPSKTTNFGPMLQRRILVTGAAGYVGSVLCRQLLDLGYAVRGVDVLLFGEAGLRDLYSNPHFSLVKGDLCDPEIRKAALEHVEAVIHLAAIVGDPACKQFPEVATALMDVASRALFEEAEEVGVSKFVFASTCSNYGQMAGEELLDENSELLPQSHYARLKVGFEEYLLAKSATSPVTVSILRFATAYGLSPRMRFDLTVNHFTRDLVLGKELTVFGEHQWRPYCHVQNLAQAICLCLTHQPEIAEGVFNIGDSTENYTKAMIVAEIQKVVPECKFAFGNQLDTDTRNYRVNFDKAARQLQFVVTRRVPDGIREIQAVLNSGQFDNPFDRIYQNC